MTTDDLACLRSLAEAEQFTVPVAPRTLQALLDAAALGLALQRATRDLLAAWPNIVNHPRLDNVEVAALRAALAETSDV